ncbi:MAG: CHASE2 domain-containing protein [Gammaproteobacteria bacterium]|nr:CHASE2 domain-containing protein [Gammaproteobacteria bacterium]
MSARLRRLLPLLIVNLAILIAMLVHVASSPGDRLHWRLLDRMENLAYDARIKLTMPGDRDERIVIVDIDEESLSRIGRWPWGRDKMALHDRPPVRALRCPARGLRRGLCGAGRKLRSQDT